MDADEIRETSNGIVFGLTVVGIVLVAWYVFNTLCRVEEPTQLLPSPAEHSVLVEHER